MSFYEGPHLQLDDSAMDRMLKQREGEVGRHLHAIGLQIIVGAKVLVPRRTGRLARSIYLRHGRDARGQSIQVGSDVHYALEQHEGVRPHIILPEHGRILRFRSGGKVIFARKVLNPGFRGRKYLTIPLRQAVRR